MIKVVAAARIKPGMDESYKKMAEELIPPTRKEEGCISYHLYENREDKLELTFIEEWESEAALAAHNDTPHFQKAAAELTELVAEPLKVVLYKPVL